MIVTKYYNTITLTNGEDFVCEAEVDLADHHLTVRFTTASEYDLRFFEIQQHDEGYYLFNQPDLTDRTDRELGVHLNEWFRQLEGKLSEAKRESTQN
ncbi:MAG TPA: hypothetical protein VGD92_00460 [Sphingobacteriaceae bacterium]